jgi:hypothetical protein
VLKTVANSLRNDGWNGTLCYNNSILLDTDLNWRSPNFVFASSGSGLCGWSYERNHARLWTSVSADQSFLWIAASYEHYCAPNIHCISDNGYDRGASAFVIDLSSGLLKENISHSIGIVSPPYSPGSINGISYGNMVWFIRID